MSAIFSTPDIGFFAVGERFSGHGVTFQVVALGPEADSFSTRVVEMTGELEGFRLRLEQEWIPQPNQRYWYPKGFQGDWYELHATENGKTVYRCRC